MAACGFHFFSLKHNVHILKPTHDTRFSKIKRSRYDWNMECLSYINDFKLYSKWTGEINKAIAYRKLKNRPLPISLCKGPFFAQDLLFSSPGPDSWDCGSTNISAGELQMTHAQASRARSCLVWVEVAPPGTKNHQCFIDGMLMSICGRAFVWVGSGVPP